MVKLVTVAAVGLALVTVGCEQGAARPAEAPHAGAPAVAPPAPPAPPPPPADHAGAAGWPHHGEHGDGDGREAHHGGGGPGEHDGNGPHAMGERMPGMRGAHARPGPHGGEHVGPGERGGNAEMARELAMLGVHFYPAPTLIRRAKEIGLTPEQVTKVRAEMLATQSKAIDLHAKVEHSRVEAAKLLSADKVDEKAVDAQIDEATKAEAEMHKLHVGAMLRIRALLTPEQRQKLDEKKPRMHRGGKPGAGPGPMGQAGQPGQPGPDDDEDDEEEDDDA